MPAASPSAPFPRLLADIGGTNARFGWQAAPGEPVSAVRVLACAEHPSLMGAIRAYLAQAGLAAPRAAALAIASPITGDQVRMTNHHWGFSQAELKAGLGLDVLRLLNDFTALALSLPAIPAGELRQVGGGPGDPAAAVALLGAGTGLGVSGLLPDGRGGWVPIQGEGGHVTLPAASPRERLVMDALAQRHGRASAERLLSGPGLLEACQILCAADGVAAPATSAEVTAAALASGLPQAQEALTLFCALLGSVAGNLALTLGARGGVYVGGGIVPRLGDWFDRSPFRARFERKGRYRAYLADIPVWVITSPQSPALLGAARALA
ncbi:glucokinase [Hydrogenophaga sp. NFH-34]|uniref:glucokinase n=3 Tax=Hydrogenophaga TaxID=47420 RepID=UPI001F4158D7|nr:glucokinase [Hydrogenophaga sp. NFH-34]